MLPPGADPAAIAGAVSTVLDDVRFREAAGQFADTIGRCGGAVGAVNRLEALAHSTSAELAGA